MLGEDDQNSKLHAMQEMQVEAQLVLATLLESQAYRADARRHPNTAGPSSRKTAARTQGLGRTPYMPGDTPTLENGRAGMSQSHFDPSRPSFHGFAQYPFVSEEEKALKRVFDPPAISQLAVLNLKVVAHMNLDPMMALDRQYYPKGPSGRAWWETTA